MIARTFGAALVLSLMLHLFIITTPGWHLPRDDETVTQMIEATLVAKPQPQSQPIATPQPRPQPKPRPKPVALSPAEGIQAQAALTPATPSVNGTEPVMQTESTPPAAVPAQTVETEAPAVEIALPRQGKIIFSVRYGGNDFEVGKALHTWQHDGREYQLRNVSETAGLVALFRSLKVIQSSEGVIAADGLQPREFRVEHKGGKESNEIVRFDWQQMRGTLTSGGRVPREEVFTAGALDLLALAYQFAVVPPKGQKIELMITTGKNFRRHAIEVAGEEKLPTPFGELRTLHLRTTETADNQRTEFWLALEFHYLPVRIRHVDRKGDIFDQVVVEMEYDGSKLTEKHQ